MPSVLSPAKALLLAVHFATHADMDSFARLCRLNALTLHEELVLRILLSHLPETMRPALYVGFLKQLSSGHLRDTDTHVLDFSPVTGLTEAEATKKARRLHLRSLKCPEIDPALQGDSLGSFLVLRTRSMDCETGMPLQVLDLLLPFVHPSSYLYTWTSTILLPYVKKEQATGSRTTLLQFERMSDAEASNYLLPQSDTAIPTRVSVDRDLREILGPWLYNLDRWKETAAGGETACSGVMCEGWQEAMGWLVSQAASSWPVAVQALEKWGGLDDVDFGYELTMQLPKHIQDHFRETYATTTLACVYSVQDTSLECLSRLYDIVAKLRLNLGHDDKYESLEETLVTLPDLSLHNMSAFWEDRATSLARNNILGPNNLLTSPNAESTRLLLALTLSAYILTLYGRPSSVRKVGDLTFLRDPGDQKAAFATTLRAIDNQASTHGDEYILWARRRLLWLRGWCEDAARTSQTIDNGTFCEIKSEYMDVDFLRLMLLTGRMCGQNPKRQGN